MSLFELLDKMLERIHEYQHKARHYNRTLLRSTEIYKRKHKSAIKHVLKGEDVDLYRRKKEKYEKKYQKALDRKAEAAKCMIVLTTSILDDLEREMRQSSVTVPSALPPVHNAPNVVRVGAPTGGVYCECRQPAHGDMIFCDSLRCRIGWFHFKCVWLGSAPKGAWHCPECRKDWRLSRVE